MPHEPVPIDATFFPGLPDVVRVTFDENLTPNVLDIANWDVWIEGANPAVTAAAINVNQVELDLGVHAPVNGRNDVSYSPPPWNVTSLATGVRAPAFVQYPIT